MILDELLEFADALDVSSAAGTSLEGDVIDLGATPQDYGHGQPMYLVIQVATTFTSGGSATVAFSLASDAAAAIATDGSASSHIATPAYAIATLVAGWQRTFALPVGDSVPYERYLGLLVTTAVATTTAGAVNAFLTFDPSYWKAYPDGDS